MWSEDSDDVEDVSGHKEEVQDGPEQFERLVQFIEDDNIKVK